MSLTTTIATWIVLDGKAEASEYPSVGVDSSRPEFQEVYWRCIALFFLSARIHNPGNELQLYCNRRVAEAAPPRIGALLGDLGVTEVTLPLTHRLPPEAASRWGNVFYEIDILRHFAAQEGAPPLLLADSDCIWRRPFAPFEARLQAEQCLLYTLRPEDQKNYQGEVLINGMSRRRMAAMAEELFGRGPDGEMPFQGGEFSAFTVGWCRQALPMAEVLWDYACAEAEQPDAIRTEEHVWSIIAVALGVRPYNANDIVRRIWTNYDAANARPEDLDLTLWHLPSEKKFGFRRMWHALEGAQASPLALSPEALNSMSRRFMGVPQRGPRKAALDFAAKIRERLGLSAGLGRAA
ncbi:hypothetical protein JYK14_19845 [Siccirubricoccus sp. KC 17139]|uniref:Nucleotide-diphospho-sugar transferase n=1 Tax=Siccirubricoccus soli TaxID=2899147 RepID=A0ABT1D962_9PROT|nr:hypothetical protein [Siccirubricoccus soli]MCO6418399.1 hypothetical protein [Siccirubricoccus soli]MCP2684534.1 hypothetical protein [Siccirubricoccus soli]